MDYSLRIQRLSVRLARVDAALSRLDEHDCQAQLPADLQRPVHTPILSRAALKGLQTRLATEIGRAEWSRDFQRRMPFSLN